MKKVSIYRPTTIEEAIQISGFQILNFRQDDLTGLEDGFQG